MAGTWMASGVNPTFGGTWDSFKAVHTSGTVGCCCSCSGNQWQYCNSATGHPSESISFELKKGSSYLFEQSAWYALPVGCTSASGRSPNDSSARNEPIYCTPNAPVSVQTSDTLIATWQEPSHSTSTGDNCGTATLDLYGIQHPLNTWVKLGSNMYMYGNQNSEARYPEAVGVYSQFKAVWRSGFVACNWNYNANGWQSCEAGNYYSFELKMNGGYLFEQSSWWALPSRCTVSGGATGDIICTPASPVTIRNSDTLQTTWQEPSHFVSTSDNHGTLVLDLWGYRTATL
jgi:hypothetical protein